ncbi:MAG TPA: hypothetical protein VMP89_10835 [Solirubrobacteraceae bacterium]|nr:hypothetical protein [Solirubrobacteraceae bacterium]
MALPFVPSDAGLLVLQASLVAAPRAVPQTAFFKRFRSPAWALVPIGSIVVVVFAIRYVSDTATGLTYLALIAIPPLAAAALAWAIRGGRVTRDRVAASVAIAGGLFAVAWIWHHSLAGELAAALLSGLSCVTLAVLLSAVAPSGWLKLGIIAMAVADVWLVGSDLLQAPNATLVAASPAGGLPQLQSELFGSVSMGYGDLFVAALLGAVLAGDRRRQLRAALLTLVIAAVFDLLFLVVSELPATVPVALALVVVELRGRVSAPRRWSLRADAIPRQAR